MIRGYYTSLSGMLAAMNRQSVVADNMANVNTTGFHQSRTGADEFGLELASSLSGPIGHLGTAAVATGPVLDTRQGPILQTDQPTDLAIEGEGLFVVRLPDNSVALTRSGDFTISAGGTLETRDGYAVLDTTGRPIQVDTAAAAGGQTGQAGQPGSSFSVGPDGTVAGTGQQLAIVGWPQGQIVRLGDNLFAGALPYGPTGGVIRQGALEGSNVDSAAAMTDLITLQRSFALSSRALSLQDQTLGDAAQIGRLR